MNISPSTYHKSLATNSSTTQFLTPNSSKALIIARLQQDLAELDAESSAEQVEELITKIFAAPKPQIAVLKRTETFIVHIDGVTKNRRHEESLGFSINTDDAQPIIIYKNLDNWQVQSSDSSLVMFNGFPLGDNSQTYQKNSWNSAPFQYLASMQEKKLANIPVTSNKKVPIEFTLESQSTNSAMHNDLKRLIDNPEAEIIIDTLVLDKYNSLNSDERISILNYYWQEADKDNSKAMVYLGCLYSSGADGLAKDVPLAIEWYKKAAKNLFRISSISTLKMPTLPFVS